jgi:NAD(P)-dependent dehydrogenase (short-subunit alcohol dehydrogenase family)
VQNNRQTDHSDMNSSSNVVLITGASKGLGRAIARLLARRGHPLIINARHGGELADAERELALLTEVLSVAGDVSEIAEEIAAAALQCFGGVDVLVNNASELGPSPMPPLQSHPWQSLLRIYRVNVVAPLHLSQLLLPGMKERRRGLIVNISSDAGVNAYPGWGGYGSSKAALEHASRILASELEGTGVGVLVVDPGDMNTEMHRLAAPGTDLSGLPSPDDVAPAIVALLNDPGPFARIEVRKLEAVR